MVLALIAQPIVEEQRFRWKPETLDLQRQLDSCVRLTAKQVVVPQRLKAAPPLDRDQLTKKWVALIRKRCSRDDQALFDARIKDIARFRFWNEGRRLNYVTARHRDYWAEMPRSILVDNGLIIAL